ncbi:serine/threonine protein kinase [Streptomyces camponoticapitis]|uniref:non-specific serine/threonine protein kinase n=1 Tax=Streptomyces camponoticapitis TaxID=1616125 RepID=A0ABQ2E774_9ACTN|nr:serine/threonine-protein kinase [Streptomyces camponoticapitis]GGJ93458.1 serine/threonine protein kinase [Streptomyces camponoticapitis]
MEHSEETREGQTLAGRYKLGEAIGRGGMGQVWRAYDELLNRTVAVKELTAALYVSAADRAVLHARTQKEARAAARISHPAVVTVHDVLDHGGRPWIVMQYVDGPSLADALTSDPIVVREAARIGLQVLAALRAAHAAGVLHRDVKPGNVLLARDGRVLLTDFGIAAIEGDSAITRTGELVGSIDYLAPERVRGSDPGPASDLWSLGATLHTAVEGTSPFRRTSAVATMQAVITDDPPAPLRAGPLAPVITALLHKDPEARPDSAEVERMLREVLEGREPEAARREAATAPVPPHTPHQQDQQPETSQPQAQHPQALQPQPQHLHTPPPHTATPYPSPYGHTPPHAYPQSTSPQTVPTPAAKRRWPVVVVAVVAAALIGGVAGYFAIEAGNNDDPGTSAGANPEPSGSSSDDGKEPSPNNGTGGSEDGDGGEESTGGESTDGDAVPDGWVRVDDPAGFSLIVPDGWQRQMDGDQIDYTPDNGLHLLRIAVDTTPDFENPYQHMKNMELEVGKLPLYDRVKMRPNNFRGQTKAALWEFTWTERQGHKGERRAIDQMYYSADGSTEYAIYMSGPVGDWSTTRSQFDIVLGGWQPDGEGRSDSTGE